MNRFTVDTITTDIIHFKNAEYVITGPWDKIEFCGPKKFLSKLDAWAICDDLNKMLENKLSESEMKTEKVNELLTLLSNQEIQESLKELIPHKLFLLDNIIEDVKRTLNPPKESFDQMKFRLDEKLKAAELLKGDLKDVGLYLSYERRFFYHIDNTPTMSVNVAKGLDVYLHPQAFNLDHDELWKVLRLIKGISVNNIDLDIE